MNAGLVLATSSSIHEIASLLRRDQPSKELKKFCSHLRTHCHLVSEHVSRIKTALPPDSELIIRILDLFESLIIASPVAKEDAGCTHPRQTALNHRWYDLQHKSHTAKLDFACNTMNFEQFTEQCIRQQFDEQIDVWEEDLIAKYPEDGSHWTADTRPPPKSRDEPSYVISSVAKFVFKALTSCTKCECHQLHELDARLCLGTYRKPDPDNTNDFDVFL